MENLCKTGYCRKKLGEYRELTTKLYDDIDSLETDIKDKDTFLQTVVKARNALQNDIFNFKKKNAGLTKENDDLTEKVEQLDEDTDDGIKMLRNAHERERVLNKEVKEWSDKFKKKTDEVTKMEKEKQEMLSKFNFLKEN